MPVSPASRGRARALDRALDQANPDRDRNRVAAQPLRPSHGDKSVRTPNTNNRRVGS